MPVATLLVAGLTGSGKTSATKLAAERLAYDWVSGSDLRRQFFGLSGLAAGGSRLGHALSEPNLHLELERLRSNSGEQDFDAELLRIATSTDNAVFDVWFLPWLVCDHPVLTVLLRASLQVRVRRVAHMMGFDATQAAGIISEKDERARRYARKQYGINIDQDNARFSLVLDTDELTTVEVASRLSGLIQGGTGAELE
jgi:cytidylate kinase